LISRFQNPVKVEFAAVNDLIVSSLHSDVDLVENIGHYIVESGGKRLRPLLVLLSAMANDYRGEQHVAAAAVIEFIHTATLLHDDVVDVSALRRGRQTVNSQWGNAPSVLVGDFLYSRAFQMLVEIGSLPIMAIIADASNLISEGEVQQMANAGNPEIGESTYNEVIYKKTAVLFEASARIGGILAGQCEQQMAAFGKHLGMAFQITDDILDYRGVVGDIGKNIGADLGEGKMTLPLIYAREQADVETSKLIKDIVKGQRKEEFSTILEVVEASGGLDYALGIARHQVQQARLALVDLPRNPHTEALLALADFSISRMR
jgi:octaprenyl-diphosphate synthase|tara:strand:- start:1394 stop:2350 length:957 start_codon:yes stop_codon:yes gene_type:complete